MEGMRLRIKDMDFDRHVTIVRDAKGGKVRVVVMLPHALEAKYPLDGLQGLALVRWNIHIYYIFDSFLCIILLG
jgi:integrase